MPEETEFQNLKPNSEIIKLQYMEGTILVILVDLCVKNKIQSITNLRQTKREAFRFSLNIYPAKN